MMSSLSTLPLLYLQPPALLQADKDHADIYSVIQLLVTIVLDGLANVVAPKNLPPHCPILDMVLDVSVLIWDVCT